jgi:hypothetical protein
MHEYRNKRNEIKSMGRTQLLDFVNSLAPEIMREEAARNRQTSNKLTMNRLKQLRHLKAMALGRLTELDKRS